MFVDVFCHTELCGLEAQLERQKVQPRECRRQARYRPLRAWGLGRSCYGHDQLAISCMKLSSLLTMSCSPPLHCSPGCASAGLSLVPPA